MSKSIYFILACLFCATPCSSQTSQHSIPLNEALSVYNKAKGVLVAHTKVQAGFSYKDDLGSTVPENAKIYYTGFLQAFVDTFGNATKADATGTTPTITETNPDTGETETYNTGGNVSLNSSEPGAMYYEFNANHVLIEVGVRIEPDGLSAPDNTCVIAVVPQSGYQFGFTSFDFLKALDSAAVGAGKESVILVPFDINLRHADFQNGSTNGIMTGSDYALCVDSSNTYAFGTKIGFSPFSEMHSRTFNDRLGRYEDTLSKGASLPIEAINAKVTSDHAFVLIARCSTWSNIVQYPKTVNEPTIAPQTDPATIAANKETALNAFVGGWLGTSPAGQTINLVITKNGEDMTVTLLGNEVHMNIDGNAPWILPISRGPYSGKNVNLTILEGTSGSTPFNIFFGQPDVGTLHCWTFGSPNQYGSRGVTDYRLAKVP